jgi:uncharacterized protein YjcR
MRESKIPNNRDVLTPDDVRDIKKRLRYPYHGINKKIAEEYGVNPVTISDIRTKKRWSHIRIPY